MSLILNGNDHPDEGRQHMPQFNSSVFYSTLWAAEMLCAVYRLMQKSIPAHLTVYSITSFRVEERIWFLMISQNN